MYTVTQYLPCSRLQDMRLITAYGKAMTMRLYIYYLYHLQYLHIHNTCFRSNSLPNTIYTCEMALNILVLNILNWQLQKVSKIWYNLYTTYEYIYIFFKSLSFI